MGTAVEILALEEQRRQAMLAADTAGLAALLAPDLRYVHSSGGVETRASLLGQLREGRLRYRRLALEHLAVSRVADAATVSGEMRAEVQRGDALRQVQSCYLAVWLRRGMVWQLVAFQATALPVH